MKPNAKLYYIRKNYLNINTAYYSEHFVIKVKLGIYYIETCLTIVPRIVNSILKLSNGP